MTQALSAIFIQNYIERSPTASHEKRTVVKAIALYFNAVELSNRNVGCDPKFPVNSFLRLFAIETKW
ncbi:hypothetical protein [Nostoc sp.]|uniref:hypothetical protein n=1 Tax=Nostoc sp. TaxID=1180 RepID=UPI002FF8D6B4